MWFGLVLALSAGCNDEPGTQPVDAAVPDAPNLPPEEVPDGVHIRFPPPRSLSESVSRTITVRGTASLAAGVSAVRVNGVAAETSDDFLHWYAVVPLSEPETELVVDVDDGQGNTLPAVAQASVTLGAVLRAPMGMAVDTTRARVIVIERDLEWLVALDLDGSGGRTVVSSRDVGAGPMWGSDNGSSFPSAIALDEDQGVALVVERDGSPNRLLSVDLATGDRTVVSGGSVGAGPDLEEPQALAVDPARGRVLIVDGARLLSVDLATGDRQVLSGAGVGAGPAFDTPMSVIVDVAQDRILVLDRELDALFAVEPDSGDRVLLSRPVEGIGSGPSMALMSSMIASNTPGRVLAGSTVNGLMEIDLSTGDRHLVAYGLGPGPGHGFFGSPSLAADPRAPDSVLILRPDGVYAIDLRAARPVLDLQPLVPGAVGQGVALTGIRGIAVDPDADRVLVVDPGLEALVSVDLTTGDRTILSHRTVGTGEIPDRMLGLVMDAPNRRVITLLSNSGSDGGVMTFDLVTGDRSLLARDSPLSRNGVGPIVMDQARGRLLAADGSEQTPLAIDLDTGEVRPLLAEPPPDAWTMEQPHAVILDDRRDRLLVLGRENGLLAYDASTGESLDLPGTGPELSKAVTMTLDRRRDRALVADEYGDRLVQVSLETGERTLWPTSSFAPDPARTARSRVMVVDEARDRLLIADESIDGIMVMDLAGSGEWVLVSR